MARHRAPIGASRLVAALLAAGVLAACTAQAGPGATPPPGDTTLAGPVVSRSTAGRTVTTPITRPTTARTTTRPTTAVPTTLSSTALSTTVPTAAPPDGAAPGPAAALAAGSALALLASLPVKGRAPKTGYSRAQFGDAWTDDVSEDGGHNGCDTRNDVLRRDLASLVVKIGTHGCVAAAGSLVDPYTGRTIAFTRGARTSNAVQIDHVVALSDAWQTGAQALSAAARQNLAGDPLELLAVDGPTNEAKGDGDAATWLPPDKAFRCDYVARQVAVKAKYSLWVTPAERTAIWNVLTTCPTMRAPTAASTNTPALRSG